MATLSERLFPGSRSRRSRHQPHRRRAVALEGLENRIVLTQIQYGLFDTGVDLTGNALAGGATDPNYSLSGTTGMGAVVASKLPIAWIANTGTSAWIAPSADQAAGTSLPGTYDYQTTFTVPASLAGAGLITGSFTADDALTDVLINGVSTGFSGSGPLDASTPLSVSGNFVAGSNTLTFQVLNSGLIPSATGIDIRNLGLNVAPAVALTQATEAVAYGGTATDTGTFADPDAGDTVTLTSSQGTVTQTGDQSGTFTFTQSNITTGGPVTITATDEHGNARTTTFTIGVTAPSISAGGTASTAQSGGPATLVDPNVTITDVGGPNLTSLSVSIGTNFTASEDQLLFTPQNGITGSYNTATGILTLSGTATPAQYQTALRSVEYQDTNANPVTANRLPRTISFSIAPGDYDPDNGHFYQVISDPNISWTDAKTAADASTLFGLKGYLATLTSAAENTFAYEKAQFDGWIGGSDAASPGVWAWADGPENGLQFWSGTVGGTAVARQYNNWAPNQPDDSGGNQQYLRFLGAGAWDDYDNTGFSPGYLIEFGGSAGDPTLQLTSSTTVDVTSVSDTPVVTSTTALVNTANTTITGTADAGSLVKIYHISSGTGTTPVSVVVASEQLDPGQTSFSIVTPLSPNTTNNFVATATEGTASESAPAVVPTITSDTLPPAPPTVTSPAMAITVKAGPDEITGTAEAGSLVNLYADTNGDGQIDDGEVVVGTEQLAAGQTTFSFDATLAANAANHFLVTASDAVGNVSGVAVVPTITTDSIAPAPPTVITPAAATLVQMGPYTVTGTAEAGSLVQIYGDTNDNGSLDTGEVVVGTEQLAAGQTSYSISVPLAANAVNYFLVTASDAAGNVSGVAVVPTITTDSIVPAPPTVITPAAATLVQMGPYTVTGTAEAGSLVQIYGDTNDNGTIDTGEVVVGSEQLASGQTSYSISVPLAANAVNHFLVTASDSLGNVSGVAVVPTITTDSSAPAAPVITDPSSATTVTVTTVTISGTAEAGSLVNLYSDINGNGQIDATDSVVGTEQLAAGQTAFSFNVALGSTGYGAYHFLATATDAVGNVSAIAVVPTITYQAVTPPGNLNPSFSGTVFLDQNASAFLDTGEPGLAGRTVYLDLQGTKTFATGDPTTTTDASGNFTFNGYTNTQYTVREDTTQDIYDRYVVDQNAFNTAGTQTVGVVPFSPIYPIPVVPNPFNGNSGTDADSRYVQALYKAILGRTGGDPEIAAWVGEMSNGTTAQQVATLINNSPEHRTDQVAAFYSAFLHRGTDPYSVGWVQELESGVSEEKVAEGILSSNEYLSAHTDSSLFVHDLYLDVLGRQGEAVGIAAWEADLAAGMTQTAVVARFVESPEANDQIVESLYTADLNRQREGGGSATWTTLLAEGVSAGNVASGILSSPEFQSDSTPAGITVPPIP